MAYFVLGPRATRDPLEILTWLQEPIPPRLASYHVHLDDGGSFWLCLKVTATEGDYLDVCLRRSADRYQNRSLTVPRHPGMTYQDLIDLCAGGRLR